MVEMRLFSLYSPACAIPMGKQKHVGASPQDFLPIFKTLDILMQSWLGTEWQVPLCCASWEREENPLFLFISQHSALGRHQQGTFRIP